jgi:PadR family transcriptional regulator PadR
VAADPVDLLPGTLELLVLKALSLEPMHGWGIGQRMLRKGWIRSEWRTTDNSRRARYYVLTSRGQRQLETETEVWHRTAAAVNGILRVRTA